MKNRIAVATAVVLLATVAPASAFGAKKGPLDLQATVSPAWTYFGDAVTAKLDVLFNPRRVAASTVQISPSFGNWQQTSGTRFAKSKSGNLVEETWWFPLDCLTFACLPRGPIVQGYELPTVTIKARQIDGTPLVMEEVWPTIHVSARFLPPALPSARPAFRLQTRVPAPSYSVAPSLLALLLDLAGALLLAAAVVAAALVLRRAAAARRGGRDNRSPLQRAVALVRDAADRGPDDRRRAVGLLARTLPSSDESAGSASELAWSADEPLPLRLATLADTVEAELGERR